MFLVETIFATFEQQQPPQVVQVSQQQGQQQPSPEQGEQVVQNIPQEQIPPEDQYYDPDLDDEEMSGEDGQVAIDQSPATSQELLPIRRYYLLEKIRLLKSRLKDYNVQNDDLDVIIKFSNQLSYNSLVSLVVSLLPVIEEQIVRLNNNNAKETNTEQKI